MIRTWILGFVFISLAMIGFNVERTRWDYQSLEGIREGMVLDSKMATLVETKNAMARRLAHGKWKAVPVVREVERVPYGIYIGWWPTNDVIIQNCTIKPFGERVETNWVTAWVTE